MRTLLIAASLGLVSCQEPKGICRIPGEAPKTGDRIADALAAKDKCLAYRALTVAQSDGDIRDLAQGVAEVCSIAIDAATTYQIRAYSPAVSQDELESALKEARSSAINETMYDIAHMRAKKCKSPD